VKRGRRTKPVVVAAIVASLLASSGREARADSPVIDASQTYDLSRLELEGNASTSPATFHELLPRPLPTTMTGAEIVEFRRRVKNLALFDAVDVEPSGGVLRVRVRHETTISPIMDFSTGKTLSDTKVTLGAIEHDLDGHATRLGGNPNHSALVGSQQGVRGLPDALYRNQAQSYANVELRHALSLGKRWYLQGVVFSCAATFRPMDARGRPTEWLGALSTGAGLRLLPTALVDTVLRIDGSRLHYPFGAWFVQFGINQYI
jgi:hypothetical protein